MVGKWNRTLFLNRKWYIQFFIKFPWFLNGLSIIILCNNNWYIYIYKWFIIYHCGRVRRPHRLPLDRIKSNDFSLLLLSHWDKNINTCVINQFFFISLSYTRSKYTKTNPFFYSSGERWSVYNNSPSPSEFKEHYIRLYASGAKRTTYPSTSSRGDLFEGQSAVVMLPGRRYIDRGRFYVTGSTRSGNIILVPTRTCVFLVKTQSHTTRYEK